MITSIAFTVYPVSDIGRARKFYEEVLGLRLDQNFGGQWIEYDIGGQTFAITTMLEENKPGAKGAGVGFEVNDFDRTIADLRKAGVKFLIEPFETPVCRMAVIADPDGNGSVIHKRHK
jgi:predicted enzyme related to lactoylglutathione lyase